MADHVPLLVEVYGSMALHPWIDPARMKEDMYSLFMVRSRALGWLSSGRSDGDRWGMNDAGARWEARGAQERLAWVQVTAEVGGRHRQVPVQPLLECVQDCLARVGDAAVDSVRLLLPLNQHEVNWSDSLATLNWFTDLPSDHQIGVAVTSGIDGGADVAAVEAAVLGASRRFNIAPFRLADQPADRDWSVSSNLVDVTHWGLNLQSATSFGMYAPEWSMDALGWIALFIAQACAGHGISALALTLRRTERLAAH